MAGEAWLLGAAAPSLIALVIFWVLGASLSAAVTAAVWTSAAPPRSQAVWTSAAMVVIIELAAGVRAEESERELAAQIA